MATIEPRLMHLLNDSKTPDLPPVQLSFQFGPSSSNNSLSLPPIEPDVGGQRGDKPGPKQIPPFHTIADKVSTRQNARPDGLYPKEHSGRSSNKAVHPPQLLLKDPEINGSSHSLRMILDDMPDVSEDAATKKRQRALTVKDDFVQLPQPLKKQKSTQQVVPPIINGLHEPPPDAAVFPPIASGSFGDAEAPNLSVLKDFANAPEEQPVLRKKATKPRKRWSEEETNHLLLGASRHGVGKWTNILEDPDFRFNGRNAGDLKDRFRTCCPAELRAQSGNGQSGSEGSFAENLPGPESRPTVKKALLIEDILIDTDESGEREKVQSSSQHDSDYAPKQRRSRAHRKKIEDLVELGIRGPFKRSVRRERRPFTVQDDKEILEGLDEYGPSWTKIQRDPRFNLSCRQPTDLRDRVRNKYPEIYAKIEKANLQVRVLEPSVDTTMTNSFLNSPITNTLEPHLNRSNSREDMLQWPLPTSLVEPPELAQGASAFETIEPSGQPFMTSVGEMDISRLLLDDSQASGDQGRAGIVDGGPSPTEMSVFRPERLGQQHGMSDRRHIT